MKKILMITSSCITMLACNNQQKTDADTKAASTTTDSSTTKPQSEFADAKYTEMGKQMLAQFESDDVDAWVNNFADNAVYLWSAGDSLVGKKAIADYWKARRANVIDSIKFTNDIWLPLKVNTPQKGPDIAGVWLLSWYQVNVKYKNGKRLGFWIHNDLHYNSDDKIDRQIQYIDRAPINAALGVR